MSEISSLRWRNESYGRADSPKNIRTECKYICPHDSALWSRESHAKKAELVLKFLDSLFQNQAYEASRNVWLLSSFIKPFNYPEDEVWENFHPFRKSILNGHYILIGCLELKMESQRILGEKIGQKVVLITGDQKL